eukprot:5740140-Prymnesium_polylepis.1
MVGALGSAAGSTARLESVGGGPIALLLAEHSDARTVLVREVNATTGESVLTSAMVLVGGSGQTPLEIVQTSHELTRAGREVGGVQMWRMSPAGQDDRAL